VAEDGKDMEKKTTLILSSFILLACVGCLVRSRGEFASPSMIDHKKTSLARAACNSGSICPGISIGALMLGDSEQDAIQEFGRSDYFRNELHHPQCVDVELNWGDTTESDDLRGNGFRVYFLSNRATLIKADSISVKTKEGLTRGSTPEEIRKFYPDIKAFLLKYSASDLNGPRDLVYWVDQSGIAFELYFNREAHKREVGYIYIFDPTKTFYPACGVDILNDWVELPKFATEGLTDMPNKKK
jgi:hypothetical protein